MPKFGSAGNSRKLSLLSFLAKCCTLPVNRDCIVHNETNFMRNEQTHTAPGGDFCEHGVVI